MEKRERKRYHLNLPFPLYGVHCSPRPSPFLRIALSSFSKNSKNRVQIIHFDGKNEHFSSPGDAPHVYPPTKVQWMPDKTGNSSDLFATSSDFLRIWEVKDEGTVLKSLLANKKVDISAPLTAFDWNEKNQNLIGTCSVDTTCTIWDIEAEQMRTQLIAHDKEVFDIAWSNRPEVFATAGADGSIRMFDLRHLDHSTIIYETGPPDNPATPPLLRLCWNRDDPHYIASMSLDGSSIIILDTRMPSRALTELKGHRKNINALEWQPRSSGPLGSVSDDGTCLAWDFSKLTTKKCEPSVLFKAEEPLVCMTWIPGQKDRVVCTAGNRLHIVEKIF